jgi:hypothetical protein
MPQQLLHKPKTDLDLPVVRDATANDVLSPPDEPILTQLVGVVKAFVISGDIAASGLKISGFIDPEENSKQAVVTVETDLDVQAAMHAWSALGRRVEEWLADQPRAVRERVFAHFTTDFTWKRSAF